MKTQSNPALVLAHKETQAAYLAADRNDKRAFLAAANAYHDAKDALVASYRAVGAQQS